MTDASADCPAPSATPPARLPLRPRHIAVILLFLITLVPLFRWQQGELTRTRSVNRLRRLALGLLLYAQDWDGRMMPPAARLPEGTWLTWPQVLDAYVEPSETFLNPANPFQNGFPRHPEHGYPVRTGYALNRRFWGVFSPGPFPLDNLELPEQTALFVEAGPMWRSPVHAGPRADIALLDYGDTMDRVHGMCPYPSPHNGKMAVVAADGHAQAVTVAHYTPDQGPHDPLYGRIGGKIYNWNGGFPNGETDTSPRE